MVTDSHRSLLGVLFGFACVFPLFLRRDKKAPIPGSEVLLQRAQQQMREAQAKNRERAVQAITQKNNLQALVDQTQKMVTRLTERAESADGAEDSERRQSLLAERDQYQETLIGLQSSLASATTTTEAVKTAMRREEERIRALTAEALALRAEEKQAQIEFVLAKSKLGMTTNLMTDLFVEAQERIRHASARRDLMVQITHTVEALDIAADEAGSSGNERLRQKLIATRNALKESALADALWKD